MTPWVVLGCGQWLRLLNTRRITTLVVRPVTGGLTVGLGASRFLLISCRVSYWVPTVPWLICIVPGKP